MNQTVWDQVIDQLPYGFRYLLDQPAAASLAVWHRAKGTESTGNPRLSP